MATTDTGIRKRKAASLTAGLQHTLNPTTKPRKERQPNWSSPEVMALIHSKEKQHAAMKLTTDACEHMETASVKWGRVVDNVQNAGFSQYYQGAAACKDKWQGLFGEYKKIKDYNDTTRCNEDYFRMGSKRRKELCLPANFCSNYHKEMDRFLHCRPCLNPPHQRDSLDNEAPHPMTAEELHEYCIQNRVDPLTLGG